MNNFIKKITGSKIVVKTKRIVSLFAKYFIKIMKVITIAYILLSIPICSHRPEYGTEYYNAYFIFNMVHVPLILFWWFYWIAKITMRGLSKGERWYQQIGHFVLTMIIIIPMIYFGIFMAVFMVFNSYNDGSYDRCMKECVLPDKSNYDECTYSICDFPI